MEFTVIRHTRVKHQKDQCYGWKEIPLADSFQSEAEALKQQLPAVLPQAVWSSPSGRCVRLADAIAPDRWQTDDRLRELSFGEWEGRTWNEIPQEQLDPWMADFVTISPPGGESLQMLYNRVHEVLEMILATKVESVLLITHAGVIRCLWSYILDIPLSNLFKVPVGYGEVFRFSASSSPEFNQIHQKM